MRRFGKVATLKTLCPGSNLVRVIILILILSWKKLKLIRHSGKSIYILIRDYRFKSLEKDE